MQTVQSRLATRNNMEDLDPSTAKKLRESPSYFVEEVLDTDPYHYQKEFLDDPNPYKVFVAGRQVGKTTAISWYGLHKFATEEDHTVLYIAPTQRQAFNLMNKLKAEIPEWLDKPESYGIEYESKSEIRGVNGSKIRALPAANEGETIRGLTIDTIIVDEAAFIEDQIYTSVLGPMLFTTEGDFVLTGTPWGKEGYFYNKFNDEEWSDFRVTTMENPDIPPKKIEMFEKDLTDTEFKREILGEFSEAQDAFFKEKHIKRSIYDGETRFPPQTVDEDYLAVDVASSGDDWAVFLSMDADGNVYDIEWEEECTLPQVEGKIRQLHNSRDYLQIVIDETGMGEGPFEHLKREMRNLDGVRFTLQKKQSIYSTLKKDLEAERVTIPDLEHIIKELRAIEYELTPRENKKIHAPQGGSDDFCDALALASSAMHGRDYTTRQSGPASFRDDTLSSRSRRNRSHIRDNDNRDNDEDNPIDRVREERQAYSFEVK